MMHAAASLPQTRDLVLIGGGHAHALVLRMWGMNPQPGVRLTLITPDPVAPYTGMLPGHIAGHYNREEIMVDLVRLARFAGARLILGSASGIDTAARLIHVSGRAPVRYDVASIDVGITSELPDLPGAAEHVVAAKPLGPYAAAWQAFLARGLAEPRLAVIGAGLGGAELALAMAHRLCREGVKPQVTLIEAGPVALARLRAAARRRVLAALAAAGIAVRTGEEPARFDADGVSLRSGERVPADLILSVVGARPHGWLAATGLDHEAGFISVGPTLRTSSPDVFAAGDCAHLSHAPRPKAGVFAVRAAPVLFENLRAALAGLPVSAYRSFDPQGDYLRLIALGGRRAVADKWGLAAEGAAMWRWKDRIDRAFMEKLQNFPAPARPVVPSGAAAGLAEAMAERPLCGGCGAKMGPGALASALADLPAPRHAEVMSGPGDDAAIRRVGDGVEVLTTDHLRAVTNDARLMARIAATHALGDIWAMGASPRAALAQIILPRMAEPMQAATVAEVMAGAAEVLGAAGADILGGHTSVSAELTVGFTLTGTCARPVTKGGALPGDVLILTKPLGSGTILAAEMAGKTIDGMLMGEVWAACIASMLRPLGPASAVLAPCAHAMTDVTGFGLGGHLAEMLDAAPGTGARLNMDALPLLAGALELATAGEGSSLAPANRAALIGRIAGPDHPARALLFDPQTCGGLLVAVPADQVEPVMAALAKAGEAAWVIGAITDGAGQIELVA